MRAFPRSLLLLLMIAACSSCTGPEPPARGEVIGRLLDNDRRPLQGVAILADWSTSDRTDADGRFALRDVKPGSYKLSFLQGPLSLTDGVPLVLRPLTRPGGAAVQTKIVFSMEKSGEPLDLGTWLAEDHQSYYKRVHTTFGPYCDKAFAGETVAVPQDALPLTLEWDADSEWHWRYSETLASLPTAQVATLCLRQKKTEVGRYGGPGGPKAYAYDWNLVAVLRDGKLLRKSFSEAPPFAANVTRGVAAIATTDQEAKLKVQAAQWLREGTGETRPPP